MHLTGVITIMGIHLRLTQALKKRKKKPPVLTAILICLISFLDRALKWEDGQVPLGNSYDRDIHSMGECQATIVETQPKTFRSRAIKVVEQLLIPSVELFELRIRASIRPSL